MIPSAPSTAHRTTKQRIRGMRWNVLGHNRISSEGTMKDFMARRILVDFEWTSTSISWGSLVMHSGNSGWCFFDCRGRIGLPICSQPIMKSPTVSLLVLLALAMPLPGATVTTRRPLPATRSALPIRRQLRWPSPRCGPRRQTPMATRSRSPGSVLLPTGESWSCRRPRCPTRHPPVLPAPTPFRSLSGMPAAPRPPARSPSRWGRRHQVASGRTGPR